MILVMIAALLGAQASNETSPLLSVETQAIAACRAAWKDQPAEVQTIFPDPDVVCYRGSIRDDSSQIFVDHLSTVPADRPVYVILKSGGGQVGAGVDMANAILDRQATVIVDGLCASSCANYLFLEGKRRIVNEGSLLIYHGGITEVNYERWSAEIAQDASIENKAQALESLRQTTDDDIAKQRTLLARADVNTHFFEWMQAVFDRKDVCDQQDVDYDMVLFSDALLASQGIKIDINLAGKSQSEVDAIATQRNLADLNICYLDRLD